MLIAFNICDAKVIVEYPKTSPKKIAEVRVVGRIGGGEDDELKQTLSKLEAGGYKLKMNSVFFNTKGGNPKAAQAMGRLIRERKLFTYIATDARCDSACIYAFAGGVVRMAYGRVSVHRTSFGDLYAKDKIESGVKEADESTRAYVNEMGLSPLLTDAILTTPNWAYRDLDDKDKRRWDVHGMERVFEELWFRSAADRVNMLLDEFFEFYRDNLYKCNLQAMRQEQTVLDCVEQHSLKR